MSALFLSLAVVAIGGEEPRAFHEINADLRSAMKRESTAESDAARVAAIVDLCALHRELAGDPRLEAAPYLRSLKASLWARLVRVKKDLEREIERNGSDGVVEEKEKQSDSASAAAGQALAEQLLLVGSTLGGPAQVFSEESGAFGGGTVRDHGEALVELIERTIDPDFWEVHGGPGRIYYFAPLQALVVTATDEIHRKIGGAGAALRR